MRTLPLLFGVALVGCAAPDPAPPVPEPQREVGLSDREQIEADLKLIPVALFDWPDRTVEAGGFRGTRLKLVNTSKTRTHKVVKPGDGSYDGRREPWVHVTADRLLPSNVWEPLSHQGGAGCGLFDWNWEKDVIDLKPGEELALDDWFRHPEFDLQHPGPVRYAGHYEYRAPVRLRDEPLAELLRGPMGAVPPFALTSEPVVFQVIRPLDVRVRVKKAVKVGVESDVADAIEVTVTNTSGVPRSVGNIAQDACGLDVRFYDAIVSDVQHRWTDIPTEGRTRELLPGETVTVFGGGDFASTAGARWKGLKAGTTRLVVKYSMPTGNGHHRTIRAETELRVEG